MRPLIFLILLIVVLASVRADLTDGTIPDYDSHDTAQTDVEEPESQSYSQSLVTYQVVIVEPGQSVYGIVRKLHEPDAFTIPPDDVLADFDQLNPDQSSDNLLAGESYKFPVYELETDE